MTLHDSSLLADYASRNKSHSAFSAITNAHGLYNTQQFVLRLSPLVHRKLAEFGPGPHAMSDIGYDGARAMSTYLHETVHWWQHIGSTYGFIFSLVYPIQAHCTHFDLIKLVGQDGFKKSVFLQALDLGKRAPSGFGTVAGLANTIVNNHFDLLAFRAFTLGPEVAEAVVRERLFEAVGHAFHMTYAHTVNTLGTTVDRDFAVIPHPREWQDGFNELRAKGVEGYYYGSPIGLWPIGSAEIFEGQACFSQIQYLSNACGHRLDWDDYRQLGLLLGIYQKAFQEFLRLTDSSWPDRIDDPLIGIFLLVCDLSLNPGSGFPFHVAPNFQSFVEDVNPGARFVFFCRTIANHLPNLKTAVKRYTREEYAEFSQVLCNAIKEPSPLFIAKTFADWFAPQGSLSSLRDEYLSYQFKKENFAIRHLFAHFLAFQEDKFKFPEFFCWPGVWMVGDQLHDTAEQLFDKHGALFVDKEDNDGVFARIQGGRDVASVHAAFDEFYHNMATYDLTNQWICDPGPFRYDLNWIVPEASPSETQIYFEKQFAAAFGLELRRVKILPSHPL